MEQATGPATTSQSKPLESREPQQQGQPGNDDSCEVGNPDCGADQVGLLVARKVKAEIIDHATVAELTGDCLSLLEIWKDADAVVLAAATQGAFVDGLE